MRESFLCSPSLHGGEVCLELLSLVALFLPAGSDGLPLSEEGDCALAVEVGNAPERVLGSGEGEHWQWDRDGQVDADLTALGLVLEFAGGVSVSGEDGSTVTVSAVVHHLNGVLKGLSAGEKHDGPKDFVVVAFHAWLDHINDSGSNEVTLLESCHFNVSPVEQQLSLLAA